MFKKKSLLLLLLIGLLVFFAACGDGDDEETSGNGNDDPGTEEPGDSGDSNGDDENDLGYTTEPVVTYSFFSSGSGKDHNTGDTRIGAIFQEQTGVNFDVEHLVGNLDERIGVMLVGGLYPDVIVPGGKEDDLVDAEALIPLNDLLEEHGQNLLEMYADYIDRFTYPDGNIYYIPFGAEINEYQPMPNIDQGAFWIQREVLKHYDYPVLKTLDEYFEVLRNYKDEFPEIDGMPTVAFSGVAHDQGFFRISNAPNHLAGYPNDGEVQIDMETHEAKVYADNEHSYRYLKALNEMNDGGYLDREMFTMNDEDYIAKLTSGRVLGFFDYGWAIGDARNALSEGDDPYKEYMALPIVFDEDIKDQYIDPPTFVQNRAVGITIEADNPERIVQFWDNMIREESQRLIMWGIEGETFSIDDDGRYYRTQEQIDLVAPQAFQEEFGMAEFSWEWPRINGSFSDGNAIEPRRQPEVSSLEYDEVDREFLEAYDIETFSQLFSLPDDRPWYPAWSVNMTPGSDENMFEVESDQMRKAHYPQMILADPADFDGMWDDFVDAYSALNSDAYEDFFTRQVQARVEGNWQLAD